MENGSPHIVSGFTDEQAARLTGLSVSKLLYWDRTKFFRPQLAEANRRAPFSRVYSFQDIVALRVLRMLIDEHSISLRHLRKVAQHLCNIDNSLWASTTLYVHNKKIVFEDPLNGKKREVVSGQFIIPEIKLKQVMSDVRRDIGKLSERSEENVGKISRNRNIAHNVDVISGTRIPIRSIINFHKAGYTIKEIIAEYPQLSAEDVKAAIKFKADDKAA